MTLTEKILSKMAGKSSVKPGEIVTIEPDIDSVKEIMLDFASITGLSPPSHNPKRYLWTDAFAVCNYLELYKQSNDENFLNLALKLIDSVHHTLGRYRDDNHQEVG